jgi:hypothetical protein
MESQLESVTQGTGDRTWVTPTPYSSGECGSWLNLPQPHKPRDYVMFLDATKIPVIQGPRKVAGGMGIEYLLPDGFPKEAIVFGWPRKVE